LTVRDPETGADLPAGKNGEIMIRGPAVFKEYHGDPDATREAFDGQWLHTGDIGYYDEGDRYYIIDRMKNVIIRGGQNIYPGEIEDVIREHTAVKDVAIVGVDHEIYGEIPKAYVMVTEDREPGETLAEEIKSLGQERLVEYKVPGEIEFLERFPRGETGKILREEL
jgi:long-chain acyl-CoA synthetase